MSDFSKIIYMSFKSVTHWPVRTKPLLILCFQLSVSAWSLVNKTLSPLLTKVEPPKVPARTKKLKTNSSLRINEQGQETETKVVQVIHQLELKSIADNHSLRKNQR